MASVREDKRHSRSAQAASPNMQQELQKVIVSLGAVGVSQAKSRAISHYILPIVTLGVLALVYLLFFPQRLLLTALQPYKFVLKRFLSVFPQGTYTRSIVTIAGMYYFFFPVQIVRFLLIFQSFKFLLRTVQTPSLQSLAAKQYEANGFISKVPGIQLLFFCIHKNETKMIQELEFIGVHGENDENVDIGNMQDLQHEKSIYARVGGQGSRRLRAVTLWYLNVSSVMISIGLSWYMKKQLSGIARFTHQTVVLLPFALTILLGFVLDLHYEALPEELQKTGPRVLERVRRGDVGRVKGWNDWAVFDGFNVMRPLVWAAAEVGSMGKRAYLALTEYMPRRYNIYA